MALPTFTLNPAAGPAPKEAALPTFTLAAGPPRPAGVRVEPTPGKYVAERTTLAELEAEVEQVANDVSPPVVSAGQATVSGGSAALDVATAGATFFGRHPVAAMAWAGVGLASVGASAYHGYRRNRSVGWGIVWGLLGGLAPVITPAIAIAQGFGKPRRRR
jgi:hypothetical protein